jgi:hypothetical protein
MKRKPACKQTGGEVAPPVLYQMNLSVFRRLRAPTSAPSIRSEWPLRLDDIITDALKDRPPQNHEDRSKYVLSLQIKTLSVRERFAAQ